MGSVKDVDEVAYKWLLENEPHQWSRHAFDTIAKSDHITNNMSECFNLWLGEDRELPILSLLELYQRKVMKRLQCRLKAGTKWITPFPPVVHRKINKMIEAARNVKVRYPRSDEFEVDDENVKPCKTHVLVLGKQLCDCGMWQLSGIPCVHAIACLLHKSISNYEHYVDPKLRIPMYLQTYAYMVHLVPDKTSWPEVSDEYIWPPYRQPKVGRPSKSRRRDPNEEPKSKKVSTLRCSVYSVLGHNKKRTFVSKMTEPSSRARFAANLSQASSSKDLDYVGFVNTRNSTFGYLFLLAGEAVSWKSAKHSIIVVSTMEAEFIVIIADSNEIAVKQ
ncbi:uncharacterized protein LOC116120093 [Pistacia vera]|uniref:uncharacterized protein LOC116120093 n=1 Tax=Pistacia vera TaxID=55513 RepID=UPI001262D78A|nr:uncharacterized protein LOC116120093 [Pistacia vera]